MLRIATVVLAFFALPMEAIRVGLRALFGLKTHPAWSLRHELLFGVARRMSACAIGLPPGDFKRAVMGPPKVWQPLGIPVTHGEIAGRPVETLTPPGWDGTRQILYLHGGGYAFGSPATHRRIIAGIALRTQHRVVALDYRMGPEDPFPAGLDDARATWDFLRQTRDAGDLAVAGDSAGGGLALALMLQLRDDGEPLPRCAAVMSPWVDLTVSSPTIASAAHADYLPPSLLDAFAGAYAGQTDRTHPLVSPIYADLTGLPPILAQCGGAEALSWEVEEFVRRAADAGVDARLDRADAMIHVFQAFEDLLPEGREAMQRFAGFLRHARPADDPWEP